LARFGEAFAQTVCIQWPVVTRNVELFGGTTGISE